jgi:hypothetical protein
MPITILSLFVYCRFIIGLLLASKVWQDASSWNIEITEIYPQFSLRSVNRLERIFCTALKWELYISQSLYAKYYFALRSLTTKKDFRRCVILALFIIFNALLLIMIITIGTIMQWSFKHPEHDK